MGLPTAVVSLCLLLAYGLPKETQVNASAIGGSLVKRSDDGLHKGYERLMACFTGFPHEKPTKKESCSQARETLACISAVEVDFPTINFDKETLGNVTMAEIIGDYCNSTSQSCVEKANFDLLGCFSLYVKSMKAGGDQHCLGFRNAMVCADSVMKSCPETDFAHVFGDSLDEVKQSYEDDCGEGKSKSHCGHQKMLNLSTCVTEVAGNENLDLCSKMSRMLTCLEDFVEDCPNSEITEQMKISAGHLRKALVAQRCSKGSGGSTNNPGTYYAK